MCIQTTNAVGAAAGNGFFEKQGNRVHDQLPRLTRTRIKIEQQTRGDTSTSFVDRHKVTRILWLFGQKITHCCCIARYKLAI